MPEQQPQRQRQPEGEPRLITLVISKDELNLHELAYTLVDLEHLVYIVGRGRVRPERRLSRRPSGITRTESKRLGSKLRLVTLRDGSAEIDLSTLADVATLFMFAGWLFRALWKARYPNRPPPIEVRTRRQIELQVAPTLEEVLQEEVRFGGSESRILRQAMRRLDRLGIHLSHEELELARYYVRRLMRTLGSEGTE